jgi:predicted nucleic acid-binding Zn ribbon protein
MKPKRPKGNLEPVASLLDQALRGVGLGKRFEEYQAVEAWDSVVGDVVSQHATAAAIREGTLFVDVDSSVWMQELQLLRGEIIERLNAHCGHAFVKQIVLSMERSGRQASSSPTGSRPRDRG